MFSCYQVHSCNLVDHDYLRHIRLNHTGGLLKLHAMQALEASIIDYNIKLVLVDSIAALARSEFGRDKIVDRQQVLGKPDANAV